MASSRTSPKASIGLALSALVVSMLAMAAKAPRGAARSRARLAAGSAQPPAESTAGDADTHGTDELTASIAHEINQPLSAILANLDAGTLLWRQRPLPDDELKGILSDIRDDVIRIREIIQKLRALLGKRPLEITVVEINALMNSSRGPIDQLAQRHQTKVQFRLAPGTMRVMGDAAHLQQVLLNLVTNGMEAMSHLPPQKRQLTIATERQDKTTVLFSVADCGTGVAPARLPEIFKAFYSTKPEGMGMGLAIVKTIVEAHGGKVDVGSRDPTGAIFRVLLPAVTNLPPKAAREAARAESRPPPRAGPQRSSRAKPRGA